MFSVGICCSLLPSQKVLDLETFLASNGFQTYLVSTLTDDEIERYTRRLSYLIIVLETTWMQSQRSSSEINAIYRALTIYNKSLKIIMLICEDFNMENSAYGNENPSNIFMSFLEENHKFSSVFENASLVDGIHYPEAIHHSVITTLQNLSNDIEQDQVNKKLALNNAPGEDSGILQIRSDMSLSMHYAISVWDVNFRLFEFNREFLELFDSKTRDGFRELFYSLPFRKRNQKYIKACQNRASRLYSQKISCSETMSLLTTPRNFRWVYIVTKGLYDQDDKLTGGVNFATIVKSEPHSSLGDYTYDLLVNKNVDVGLRRKRLPEISQPRANNRVMIPTSEEPLASCSPPRSVKRERAEKELTFIQEENHPSTVFSNFESHFQLSSHDPKSIESDSQVSMTQYFQSFSPGHESACLGTSKTSKRMYVSSPSDYNKPDASRKREHDTIMINKFVFTSLSGSDICKKKKKTKSD